MFFVKKVLLTILSSNADMYRKLTGVQVKGYEMWLKQQPMDIDILVYTAGEKTELIGNTLYVACDDNSIYAKTRALTEYIIKHPEYDVIINTNACTVVNLEFINKFVNDDNMYEMAKDYFIGHVMVELIGQEWTMLTGTFMMCDRKLFMDHLSDISRYDKYNEYISCSSYHPADTYNDKGDTQWEGASNDAIWSKMMVDDGVSFLILPSISTRNKEYIWATNRDDAFKLNISPIYDQHFEIPYDERRIVEPVAMKLAFMGMMNHHITTDEYTTILSKILYNYNSK